MLLQRLSALAAAPCENDLLFAVCFVPFLVWRGERAKTPGDLSLFLNHAWTYAHFLLNQNYGGREPFTNNNNLFSSPTGINSTRKVLYSYSTSDRDR